MQAFVQSTYRTTQKMILAAVMLSCVSALLNISDTNALKTLAALSPFNRQPFLCVEAIEFLVFHNNAFAFKHHADPTIAEPTPLSGDGFHFLADLRIVRRAFTPDSLGGDTYKLAGPPPRGVS